MEHVERTAKGAVLRIVGSIIILAGFLVGSLIYIAFYTSGFSLFQKVVVFIVAFIIAVAAIAIMWVTWAGRRGWIRGWWD